MVHVRVDYPAFARGCTVAGETCEIPGLGPIPVSVARRLAGDAILKVIVTDGVAITAVAHGGRTIPAHLRTALEARDPTCIVPYCDARRDLQIDHRIPYAAGGPTTLDNLARLCRWHHYQKSHLGYRYRGGPGTWTWIPPDQPTDPPHLPP
jgi:5-methylcytosine-specific restriction endonuclease McrA